MGIPAYDALGVAVTRAATQAAHEAALLGASWARDAALTKVDAAGHRGRADTGIFIKSIHASEPVDRGPFVECLVQSRDRPEKTNVIETGRRPGKPVSLEGRLLIRKWVERKIGNTALLQAFPDQAKVASVRTLKDGRTLVRRVKGVKKADREALLDQLTFMVVRKIRLRGIPGIAPFGTARLRLAGPEGERIVAEVMARMLPRPGAA